MADIKSLKNKIRSERQSLLPSNLLEAVLGDRAEAVVRDLGERIVTQLLKNEDIMYELAMIAYKHIPVKELSEAVHASVRKELLARKDLRGKDGETPDDAHLVELIRPLIPKPVKGDAGYTPQKGKDYFDGKPGDNGKDFFTPEQEKHFLEVIVADVLNGVKSDGSSMVSAINNLEVKPELQIDASHIKNLPDVVMKETKKSVKLYGGIHRGGLKLIWNTELEGTINGVNTVFTIPATLPDPKDNKYIVSARGVAKDVDSGDFTVSNSNRTITFSVAPPTGSARPRIQLYHGK